MFKLCPPALIYLIFSITQIIIDFFKGLYNTALMKFIVMIMITILLNALCQEGLSIISWFIVFIPFILMSVIVTMLLYVFGLDVATGKLNQPCETNQSTTTAKLIIPQPFFNIFNPNNSNTSTTAPTTTTPTTVEPTPVNQPTIYPPNYSSSPEYVS